MSSIRKHLDFIFTTTDYEKVQDFLEENPKVDLTKLLDDKNSNILHQTAFQGRLALMKLYLQHMRKFYEVEYWTTNSQYKKSVKLSIQSWANEANNEGFSPIHYASYKGNVEMIRFLESLGASVELVTKVGLNVLHLAAQGDRMTSMIHFYDRFDLNCIDAKNGTPLHWACYMGSENVAAFLLAQSKVLIDVFDSQEQTPLHLATIYGNTKIVRRLLLKGADRHLINGKGEKPIQIAKANEFKNITKMLSQDYSCLDHLKFYYNIKMQYRPTNRSILKPFLLILALLFTVGTSHGLVVPKESFEILFYSVTGAFYLILLIVACSMMGAPKTIGTPKDYKELINCLPICSQCRIPRKDRSYHCDICKVCVDQYDHHCPWVNNCVGKNNIGRFIVFLVMLVIGILEIAAVSLADILELNDFIVEYRFVENRNFLKIIYRVAFGFNILLTLLYLIPVSGLLYIQCKNLFLGLTTYERFSKNVVKSGSLSRSSSIVSESSGSNKQRLLRKNSQRKSTSCSCHNCVVMCRNDPEIEDQSDTV